jgi:hypothetical protein
MTQRVPILANEALTTGYLVHAFVRNTGGTASANLLVRLRVGYESLDGSASVNDTDITLATLGAGGSKLLTATVGSGFTSDTAYYVNVSLGLHRTSSSDTGAVEFAAVQMDTSPTFYGALVNQSSGPQVIGTGSWTAITYDTDLRDPYAMHDTSSNTSRFTVPWTGKYLCIAQYTWAATTVGFDMGWSTNGASPANHQQVHEPATTTGGGDAPKGQAVYFTELSAGGYFEFKVQQASGGNVNFGGSGGCWAMVVYLGEAGS